jgi:hypothetical protein
MQQFSIPGFYVELIMNTNEWHGFTVYFVTITKKRPSNTLLLQTEKKTQEKRQIFIHLLKSSREEEEEIGQHLTDYSQVLLQRNSPRPCHYYRNRVESASPQLLLKFYLLHDDPARSELDPTISTNPAE